VLLGAKRRHVEHVAHARPAAPDRGKKVTATICRSPQATRPRTKAGVCRQMVAVTFFPRFPCERNALTPT
jgi:hypothetical protein